MTARSTRSSVHGCLREAIAAAIARMGGTSIAAGELGIDASTVRRKQSGQQQWSLDELAGVISYELQEGGASPIVQALVALADRRDAQPVELLGDLAEDISAHAELIGLENLVRVHNCRDLRELEQLKARNLEELARLAKVNSDIDATLQQRMGR